jgi:hypothetical protein
MFCRNCGKELTGTPEIWFGCGAKPSAGKNFCQACGAPTDPLAKTCVKCEVHLTRRTWMPRTVGILSIVCGTLCLFLLFSH